MSIDHGKLLALIKQARSDYRASDAAGDVLDWLEERALAQPAEPDDIAESAKKIVSELPRYFHEVRGSYVHWGVFPAKHKDGEWVKWSDVESGAFIEALIRLQSTPTANTAQPAEAVEGGKCRMCGAPCTEHKREIAPGDYVTSYRYEADAAQGAVACVHHWHDYGQVNRSWCHKCEAMAVTGYEDHPYTHPQAAPAQVPLIARAKAEWHEDDGAVMWWAWCGHEWAGEPAWCGTPNDSDWPGYHTHWTSHPKFPAAPTQEGE